MPLKKPALSPQLITFADQKAFTDAMIAKGVQVSNIREIDQTGEIISTTDPNWEDDGLPKQYIAQFFGVTSKDIEIGLAKVTIGSGGYNNFLRFASQVFVTDDPAKTYAAANSALMSLNNVATTLDVILAM